MQNDVRTYVYVLRGKRAGQFGYIHGTFDDRAVTTFRGPIEKALVRFSDGSIVAVEIDNLREATALERIMENVT